MPNRHSAVVGLVALLALAALVVPSATASAGATWRLCGHYSNTAKRIALASYSARAMTCTRALRLVLAYRQTRKSPSGFRCSAASGEAETWYICTAGKLGARAHAVAY